MMTNNPMRKAAIMARVSSDEQAAGYSLGVQEDALLKYCERNGIEIVYKFREDHSAKNFKRPAFTEFLKFAKENKGKFDQLLFITWDRFSRNLLDSLEMIKRLKGYGITASAIEQPLDLSIPENKAMLSIYLTLPEIDNDRRSIKIRGGVRAALQAGRWPRQAPYGYKNTRDDNNKPIIVPGKDADHIKYLFRQILLDQPQSLIREELKKKGFLISRSNTSSILLNPVYAGLIVVPAEGNEPEKIITGLHEGLVTESEFYRVQQKLKTKKLKCNKPNGNRMREELPLRGNLLCSKCNKPLTGSASKSRSGVKHFYYHCNYCHAERYRADLVNEEVTSIFSALNFNQDVDILFRTIMKDKVAERGKVVKESPTSLAKRIDDVDNRLINLQNLIVDGTISTEDYKVMRLRYTSQREELVQKLDNGGTDDVMLKKKLANCLNSLKNLDRLYFQANLAEKKRIIGSIFPEKIIFDGKNCRTTKLNEVIALIVNTGKDSRKSKTGQTRENSVLSGLVETAGVEPACVVSPKTKHTFRELLTTNLQLHCGADVVISSETCIQLE